MSAGRCVLFVDVHCCSLRDAGCCLLAAVWRSLLLGVCLAVVMVCCILRGCCWFVGRRRCLSLFAVPCSVCAAMCCMLLVKCSL